MKKAPSQEPGFGREEEPSLEMATEACCAVEGAPTKVPYRVLDKDYLSQQLPQLQERAPKSQKVKL